MLSTARPSPSAMRDQRLARLRVERQRPLLGCSARSNSSLQRRLVEPVEHQHGGAATASAPLSSKEGFSVVAPTSVMVPSSMCGRKLSCWARLKRWISSMKSSVPRALSRGGPWRGRRPCAGPARPRRLRKAARTRAASRWPAAAPPWSCRSRAGPTGSGSAAARFASMRVSVPSGADELILARRLRRASSAAAGRRAGAARFSPGRRLRTASPLGHPDS